MTQQASNEERIANLEKEVAELRQQLTQVLAERRPFDKLHSEIRSVGRTVTEFSEREAAHEAYVQARFGVVDYDFKGLNSGIKVLQTGQSELREEVRAGMQDLRNGQQEIAAGQQQIVEFLLGKPKTSD